MNLFNRFVRKAQQTAEPDYYPLAVLYATAPEGLSPAQGFALRDLIIAASPIDFTFLNPGSFQVFFPGTENGNQDAEALANALREYVDCHHISPFGVAIRCGPCLVEWDGKGPFTSHPVGGTVSDAMKAAFQAAINSR